MGAPHRQGRRSSPSCRSNLRRGGGAERSPIAHCSGASQHALPHTSMGRHIMQQQEVHPPLLPVSRATWPPVEHAQLVRLTTTRWTNTRLPAHRTCSCTSAPAPLGCRGGQRTRGTGGRPHSGSWNTWRVRTSGSAQGACGTGAVGSGRDRALGVRWVFCSANKPHPLPAQHETHEIAQQGRMTARPQLAARPQPTMAQQATLASIPPQPAWPPQPAHREAAQRARLS